MYNKYTNGSPIFEQIITYRGCPINFKPERVAGHSATWRTYKVHVRVEWFKTSQKSVEGARYGQLYTSHISHLMGISGMFSWNTPQNTKHSLYTFCISGEYRVLLMMRKNKPWNLWSFLANANPGAKCKKRKKVCEMRKKWREISPYTFCFSHPFSHILR